MNKEFFKDKKCFIYPFSNSTKILENHLTQIPLNFLGYVDKNLDGENIYKVEDIVLKEFDFIFIYSPNHEREIYNEITKYISKEKIICVRFDEIKNDYIFLNDKEPLAEKFSYKNQLMDYFVEKQKNYILSKDVVLLIGIDFIDLNIKYLYLYLKKYSNFKVYLATNNKRDIQIFKEHDIDVIDYDTKEFIDLVFEASIKIIDHNPVDKLLVECLKIGKSVQLWHGITIETLGVLTNYKVLKYDIVLSTSPFVSEYSFSKIYDYKKIIHCGYPRNDVLHNDGIEHINVDINLLNEMKNDSYKYIVYMPTHRPLGFKSNPLDYEKLNQFAKDNELKIIIKMHPFVAQKIRDDLSSYQNKNIYLSNLIIHESHMDIYPLLKYSDMLISDYSSVYFDYLYVNKPIVFFCYDYEEWVNAEQGVILDYFSHSPGDKCYMFEDLLDKVLVNLENDNYKEDRKLIFEKMFENKNQKASSLLHEEIKKLL
ncbi:CDP-glycerol glycerophosphotransferase family protein [Arcobacter sp.]|uniref:CDP-glycerol glycerophosphotransferase family protein n=1 Tax=unclassified Arcobacter TaxID=2593671 RepID=UPI003AFF6AC9